MNYGYNDDGAAPGIYEVDFDTYDPESPGGWLIPQEEVDEDSRVTGICEIDFETILPPSVAREVEQASASPHRALESSPGPRPQIAIRPRLTLLTEGTWKLYNAMSFLTWQTGLFFGASITLSAHALGFEDHADFLGLMPAWHKEMDRCLFNGDDKEQARLREGCQRQRVSRRMAQTAPHAHYWIHAVEYSRDHGLHAHVLCVVPRYAEAAFETKTWDWWQKQSPGEVTPQGIACRFRHGSNPSSRYELQVKLFRYIIKSTAEGLTRLDHEGKVWSARQIFRPEPNDCTPVWVQVPQLHGISHRLNHTVQQAAGFCSTFDAGCYEENYSGWEYEDWKWRQERKATEELFRSLDI